MSFPFRLMSGRFNGRFDRPTDDRIMRVMLETLIELNIINLIDFPHIPDLYEAAGLISGEPIYYRRKVPRGQMDDDWDDNIVVLTNGYADCEDVTAYRVAELRHKYRINARPHLTRKDYPDGGWLYHIRVELPDGTLEDPSAEIDHYGNFKNGRVER